MPTRRMALEQNPHDLAYLGERSRDTLLSAAGRGGSFCTRGSNLSYLSSPASSSG